MSKDKETSSDSGAICGGVIPESEFHRHIEKYGDAYGIMMAFVMPDKYFKEYQEASKSGDKKKADKIFREHAFSLI